MKSTKKAKVVNISKIKCKLYKRQIKEQDNLNNRDTEATIKLLSDIVADQIKILREIEFSLQGSNWPSAE